MQENQRDGKHEIGEDEEWQTCDKG